MPFIADDPNEEKKQQEQGQQGAPGAPAGGGNATVIGGGQSGSIGGGSTQAGPSAAKPSSSGSFVNLKSYLDVNDNRAAEMGERVAGHGQGIVDTATTATATARDNATTAVNDGTAKEVTFEAPAPDTAIRTPSSQTPVTTTRTVSTSGRAPVAAPAASPNSNVVFGDYLDMSPEQFTSAWNAKYKGPTDLSAVDGAKEAQSAVADVATMGNLAQDYAGQQTLLKDTYTGNGRQYDRGGGMLDTYLVGGGSDAFDRVGKMSTDNANLYKDLQTYFGGEDGKGGIVADAVTESDRVRDVFQGGATTFGEGIDDRLTDAAGQAEDIDTRNAATRQRAIETGDVYSLKTMGFNESTSQWLATLTPEQRAQFIGEVSNAGLGTTAGATESAADLQTLLNLVNGAAAAPGGYSNAAFLGAIDNETGLDKFGNSATGGYSVNSDSANQGAGTFYVADAGARLAAGAIDPEELMSVGGPQAVGLVGLANEKGVNPAQFLRPDPSSDYGYKLDTAALTAAINKAKASSLAFNPGIAGGNIANRIPTSEEILEMLFNNTPVDSGASPQKTITTPSGQTITVSV